MEYNLTPQMVDLILPMLGFSLVLNVALAAMLVCRPLYRMMARALQVYWIGFLLIRRGE